VSWWSRVRAAVHSQRAAAVVAFSCMLLCTAAAADRYDRDHHLGGGSLVADARVIGIDTQFVGRGSHARVSVELTTATGDQVRAEIEDYVWNPYPRVGDNVRVRYNPADPTRYIRDDRLGSDRLSLTLFTVGAILSLAAGIAGLRRKLPTWLYTR